MTATAPPTAAVEAIVRIRLAAGVEPAAFEAWLRRQPVVSGAWALSGDHDYELRLACPGLQERTAELRCIRQRGGAEDTVTSLVLRDVFE
ncbi:MAG: Lrp/AsnC ligand binding domain-containing protein [Actinomadura sp.]